MFCKFAAYFQSTFSEEHLWKAASERYSLLYLYSISLASRTRGRKTLFLFWRYVATTKNILSKLCKFCSILFHFSLVLFYSTGFLKNNDTNTLNFNHLEKNSWKCLWTKFIWALKRCQTQPTFIMTTCNAKQNSAVLGYFWTYIFTEHLI